MQVRGFACLAATLCVVVVAVPYFTPVATASALSASDLLSAAASSQWTAGLKTDDAAVTPKAGEEVKEKYEFQAEVGRLMDIIINSLYQKKEIFLRELISNASDALDKIRFMSLSDESQLGSGSAKDLEIRISFDKEARTLSIQDRGIGMTKQDLIQNLGTVAKSGTAQFVETMTSGGDLSMIGQFGVGFYSVYLVADRVRVTTKHNDDKQYVWESSADGSFTIEEDEAGEQLTRGSIITLFLKEDATDFVDQTKLQDLVKRYSQFITFPIYLKTSRTESYEVPVEEEAESEEAVEGEEEELEAEAEDDGVEDEPATKTETRTVYDWKLINDQKAIWTRSKDEVTDEEYSDFYKAISKDPASPNTWIHFTAEGEIEFKSILYVPSKAPSEQFDDYYGKSSALRLYVRKVLISDEFEELMPKYLSFIRGVVDSDDLPLNVSRETLQQSKVLKVMGKKLVRKALEMLRKLSQGSTAREDGEEKTDADEEEKKAVDAKYIEFWKLFGKNIKLGVIEDSSNRTKLSKLLRFHSSKSADDGYTSLDAYIGRMKDYQKTIFFIAGESLESVKRSLFLERFKAKDIEVLFLSDPIDEYAIQNLAEYDGKKLQSITKENVKFGDEGKSDEKRGTLMTEKFQPLVDFLTEVYGKSVDKVKVSARLDTTPCIISTSQYGYSSNMERIMKAQAFADPSKAQALASKKTMEINPRHPIIIELLKLVQEEGEKDSTKNTAWLLWDTALLNSGFQMADPAEFSGRMFNLMKQALSLDSLELAPELEVPEDENDAHKKEFENEDEEEFDVDADGE